MIVVTLFRVVVGFMCQTEGIFYSTIRYTTFNSLIFKGKYYFSITVRNLRASVNMAKFLQHQESGASAWIKISNYTVNIIATCYLRWF